jgi:hypothetical protein
VAGCTRSRRRTHLRQIIAMFGRSVWLGRTSGARPWTAGAKIRRAARSSILPMTDEHPWRALAKLSDDELVDVANQTLGNELLQKQIGFEMWRRQANMARTSLLAGTTSGAIAGGVAFAAVSFAFVQFFGRNTPPGQTVLYLVTGYVVLSVGLLFSGVWKRSRYARRRQWPE